VAESIKVGDRVFSFGHPGRWEVVKIEGNEAVIKLLAVKKDTGDPEDLGHFERVLLSTLTLIPQEIRS
jgi:hypothetical protein